MDKHNTKQINILAYMRERLETEGSVCFLLGYLLEYEGNPSSVVGVYRPFIEDSGERFPGVYKIFCKFFFQTKLNDDAAEVFLMWMRALITKYDVERCAEFLEYFDELHEENSLMKNGSMCGKYTKMLLEVGWILNVNGAYFESYVICERICEMVSAAGNFQSKADAASYFRLLAVLFISSNMLVSYINALHVLWTLDNAIVPEQCSFEDLKLLCSYAEIKNEGDKHGKLFCRIRISTPKEILSVIKEECFVTKECSNTVVRKIFDFKAWEIMTACINNPVPIEENLDLASFMKKSSFNFTIKDGMIIPGEFEYKTVGRRVFEIIDEYREDEKPMESVSFQERVKKQDASVDIQTKRVLNSSDKKIVKFGDRFSVPHKKMELYSEYFRMHTKGIDDTWYRTRNEACKLAFEKKESASKQNRDALRAYKNIVEEVLKKLHEKTQGISMGERNGESATFNKASVEPTHWKTCVDKASKPYRAPSTYKKDDCTQSEVPKHSSSKRYTPPSSHSEKFPTFGQDSFSRAGHNYSQEFSERTRFHSETRYSNSSPEGSKNKDEK